MLLTNIIGARCGTTSCYVDARTWALLGKMEETMAKQGKSRPAGKNHSADIKNANKGTRGTNITYDKNQGNRGKQLNPNQRKGK